MKPRRAKYSNANLWQFTRQSRTPAFDRRRYEESEEAFDGLSYLRSRGQRRRASTQGAVCENRNEAANKWEGEITANRIAVAWYREHDPQYLAKLVADFRRIQSHLPDPVPAGMEKKTYFTDNYQKLGTDPLAYGWYQLQMVLVVYDEPARSFQQVLDDLPKNRYE